MPNKSLSRLCYTLVLITLGACKSVPDTIEPQVTYSVQEKYLQALPSPFPPLSPIEKSYDWGKEYLIGLTLATELDLYQAITAFKRASILIPQENTERALEIQYNILLCYYVGHKYSDVIYTFNHSKLKNATTDFPAMHDLLIILHDSYLQEGNTEQANRILSFLESQDPNAASQVTLSTALSQANFPSIDNYVASHPNDLAVKDFIDSYTLEKKSPGKAQLLNAMVPGAGYLYVGQKQSAVTAFLLNGLFIAAATHFFQHRNIAAGVIFTSFEAGWYFGGIYGAGLEAKFYNERLYERKVNPLMNRQGLFPVLMLKYAF